MEKPAGGVLQVSGIDVSGLTLALHVVLLDGQTWAYWLTDRGTWLGLASVGSA